MGLRPRLFSVNLIRTIDIIQDDEAERDEDFLIYVTIAENAEVDSDVGNQVTVTILDDD